MAKKDFCGTGRPTVGGISHLVRVRVRVRGGVGLRVKGRAGVKGWGEGWGEG